MSTISPADVRVLPSGPSLLERMRGWVPVAVPIALAILIIALRVQFGQTKFLYDGTLIVLALVCYLFAAVIGLIEMYAEKSVLGRWGLWMAASGYMFNLAAWGTRWVAAGDREQWVRWVFRYVPFANLYDLSIAFAMGAGLTTLVICRKKENRVVMGVSMLMAALVVMLAIFLGRQFIDLPPVLDSYWRPIHVGIASTSYGVVLVCFSIAVLYLLKDGFRIQAMGVFVAVLGVVVYGTLNHFSLLTSRAYGLNVMIGGTNGDDSLPVRATVPFVGPLMLVALVALVAALACFASDLYKEDDGLKRYGIYALWASAAAQVASIAALFAQMSALKGSVASHVDAASQVANPKVLQAFGTASAAQVQQILAQNESHLSVTPNSNPVELGALLTLLSLTGLVLLFSFRTERVMSRLPSLERLDDLMYKTAGVAFVGLAMLLITGAIWANESWGRYWGWDSKETGALVAWLAYAGFLHTRIAHGWTGRRSAYFAVAGFLLVIFTYLGVSYLLPGLHSYA